MTNKIVLFFYAIFSAVLLFYVSLPNFDFPKPPTDSVQSMEPADTETPLRRAYFTNFSRDEVIFWYKAQFSNSRFLNIPLPTYLMNYPPEESGTIIRDQTRSTFLQEIVHPFRETLFVNGYEPRPDDFENRIVINGVHWRQKIIIKFIPTSFLVRIGILIPTLFLIPILLGSFYKEVIFIKNLLFRKK
jgi:hypothetical protein